jgi:hypothetical protein
MRPADPSIPPRPGLLPPLSLLVGGLGIFAILLHDSGVVWLAAIMLPLFALRFVCWVLWPRSRVARAMIAPPKGDPREEMADEVAKYRRIPVLGYVMYIGSRIMGLPKRSKP